MIVAEAPDPQVLAAARRGDEDAFGRLVEPHRRELHVHCYRMLASFEEAVRVGTPDIQALAQASLWQLDANAPAADIVAGIDLSAN